jgi:RNA polymerase sigma-70 factor (ECF subfamily)
MGGIHAGYVVDMSEAVIRDRTKEGFQELVLAELPGLYSLARRLVRDGAEDLVQEALLQAFRAFGTLREDGAAGRWLKTILVNVFRDQVRQRSRTIDARPMGDLSDFSLYRTLVDEDPFPY